MSLHLNLKALIEDDSQFDLSSENNTVLYIDMNNLFHRAYHVAKSQNQNPIHVLLNSIYALRSNIGHNFAFAIMDGEHNKENRLAIYPEYKATREEKNEEEKREIHHLKNITAEICDMVGITYYESPYGMEADDVIGILSMRSIHKIGKKGWNVIAVSSDKDYKQLCLYPNFNLYNAMKKTVTNYKNIKQQEGLDASQFLDYLILTGDKSDNISGISKVGDKTARGWLETIGTLNRIIVSLVREGSITKEELFNAPNFHLIPQDEKEDFERYISIPMQACEDFLSDSVAKRNLIEAIKNGSIFINRRLIEFHYDRDSDVKIPPEMIKKPIVDIERLTQFCDKYNLRQFKSKYLELDHYYQSNYQNDYHNNNKSTVKMTP